MWHVRLSVSTFLVLVLGRFEVEQDMAEADGPGCTITPPPNLERHILDLTWGKHVGCGEII